MFADFITLCVYLCYSSNNRRWSLDVKTSIFRFLLNSKSISKAAIWVWRVSISSALVRRRNVIPARLVSEFLLHRACVLNLGFYKNTLLVLQYVSVFFARRLQIIFSYFKQFILFRVHIYAFSFLMDQKDFKIGTFWLKFFVFVKL